MSEPELTEFLCLWVLWRTEGVCWRGSYDWFTDLSSLETAGCMRVYVRSFRQSSTLLVISIELDRTCTESRHSQLIADRYRELSSVHNDKLTFGMIFRYSSLTFSLPGWRRGKCERRRLIRSSVFVMAPNFCTNSRTDLFCVLYTLTPT